MGQGKKFVKTPLIRVDVYAQVNHLERLIAPTHGFRGHKEISTTYRRIAGTCRSVPMLLTWTRWSAPPSPRFLYLET